MVYFKDKAAGKRQRLAADSTLVQEWVNLVGFEVISFEEWWLSLDEDERQHQLDLTEEGLGNGLTQTELIFIEDMKNRDGLEVTDVE